jgi:hypothetical protein
MMDATRWEHSVKLFELASTYTNIRVEPVRLLNEIANREVPSTVYTSEQEEWLLRTPPTQFPVLEFPLNPGWRMANIGSSFYWSDGTVDDHGDSNSLLNNNLTDFRGWSCNIGLESLFIFWDGDVRKGNCSQGGVLFNLANHHLHSLPVQAELCFQPICYCGTDVLISKVPVIPADHPIVEQYMGQSMVRSQEDYERQHRKYIKIKPL